jgi:catechol 2,3-dioxygenase-like lactoylglutathione lyase family enzyme
MGRARKARAVGFNHVALEVGDIEQALAFYGRLFEFKLRGKSKTSAFIDLGDQFLALQKGRTQPADEVRPFSSTIWGAWNPRTALEVTQIRLRGIVLRTSVQADMHGPSIMTRSPERRS